MPDLANPDYLGRVNRAIDHVTGHLSEPLRLEDVARVAAFSPFHFHRIFKAIVGETLHEFVKRLRLEHAIQVMSHQDRRSLTEVALACGFTSSSDFSRSFRQQFGVPPRAFDVATWRRTRRTEMMETLPDGHRLTRLPEGANPDGFTVSIRRLPARRVAYLRVFKPYEGTGVLDATNRLLHWARARDLAGGQWLGYQWDDPEVVALDQCRYDVGLEVAETTVIDEGVHETRFAPMMVAELDMAGGIDLEMRALDWLFSSWLPHSGLVPASLPCFEAWNGEPFAHGMEHFTLRVHLPVVDADSPLA